jgi:hypothetical protein
MTLTVVWAREPIPAGPSIFLAGPMPRASLPVPSWHSAAISLLGERCTRPIRFTTPTALCQALNRQPGDLLGYQNE